MSLFAEFIANDKPIVMEYQGQLYFPVFATYSEKTFGGDFDTEAAYRDPFIAQRIKKMAGCSGRRFITAIRPSITT